MLALPLGIALSFLPRRYRGRWAGDASLTRGALISGALECVFFLVLFGLGYILFLDAQVKSMGGEFVNRGLEGSLASPFQQAGMGMFGLILYLTRPTTLVILYFALEGLLRFSAAIISGESVPTLPLQLIAWAHGGTKHRMEERALGPIIVDQVQRVSAADHELRILTCRPRPNWNNLMTVSYEDRLYEIVRQEQGTKPRQFVYLLRSKPEGKVVRGLHNYSPDELLPKKAEAANPSR